MVCRRSQTDGIGEDVLVVVEADEGRRPRAVGAVGEERKPERPQQREDVHHEQERDRRRDQQAARVAAPGVVDGGRRGEAADGERHPERHRRAAAARSPATEMTIAEDEGERPVVRGADSRKRGEGCRARLRFRSSSIHCQHARRSPEGPCARRAHGRFRHEAAISPRYGRLPSGALPGRRRCCRASSWRPAGR